MTRPHLVTQDRRRTVIPVRFFERRRRTVVSSRERAPRRTGPRTGEVGQEKPTVHPVGRPGTP